MDNENRLYELGELTPIGAYTMTGDASYAYKPVAFRRVSLADGRVKAENVMLLPGFVSLGAGTFGRSDNDEVQPLGWKEHGAHVRLLEGCPGVIGNYRARGAPA